MQRVNRLLTFHRKFGGSKICMQLALNWMQSIAVRRFALAVVSAVLLVGASGDDFTGDGGAFKVHCATHSPGFANTSTSDGV